MVFDHGIMPSTRPYEFTEHDETRHRRLFDDILSLPYLTFLLTESKRRYE